MGFEAGAAVALKIVTRGRGAYIALSVASLLTYYAVFIKHPHTPLLLMAACVLTTLTAVVTDLTTHTSVFYVFRISGALPSTVVAYILTVSLTLSLASIAPQVVVGDVLKAVLTYVMGFSSATLLLNTMYGRVRGSLTAVPT